jgi:hypothetical protein
MGGFRSRSKAILAISLPLQLPAAHPELALIIKESLFNNDY